MVCWYILVSQLIAPGSPINLWFLGSLKKKSTTAWCASARCLNCSGSGLYIWLWQQILTRHVSRKQFLSLLSVCGVVMRPRNKKWELSYGGSLPGALGSINNLVCHCIFYASPSGPTVSEGSSWNSQKHCLINGFSHCRINCFLPCSPSSFRQG